MHEISGRFVHTENTVCKSRNFFRSVSLKLDLKNCEKNFFQKIAIFEHDFDDSEILKILCRQNFQGWPGLKIVFYGNELANHTKMQMGIFYLSKKMRIAYVLATFMTYL